MKKLLLSLSVLVTGALTQAQTVLLDENFDSYTDFVISGFGSWQTLDLDLLTTYTGGSDNPTWANAGSPMAYQIFNPTTAMVTNASTGSELRNFDPHSGQKYAACWAGSPSTTTTANNDWLISPAVTLGSSSNTLTLWVKSMSSSYGLEKYKIGIYTGSGTPTSSANFTVISGTAAQTAPYPDWVQLTYSLPATYNAQTIRVGIQCVSSDMYMFMVDDVKITTTGALSTNEVSKSKTNIFPNPTKGEINIKTDKKMKSTSIVDISGKMVMKIYSEKVDLSSLPKGIYLMKIEFADGSITTEKVIKE